MRVRYITFVVQGAGNFPLDMLRYDQCWPSGPEDVEGIASTERTLRTVRLTKIDGPGAITTGRWESFLWRVIDEPVQ